jgi:hypothetical protein
MKVEVDQSGRIDNTQVATILAFSNSVQYTVLIPATVKRNCTLLLKKWGAYTSSTYLQFFTIGLYFLLRQHIAKANQVVIDVEFFSKDHLIKEHLLNLFARRGQKINPDKISFGYIGKKSPAHFLSLQTYRKQKKPNLVLTQRQILQEFGHPS